MIFNHFFHFWPCQVPLWAVGAEKQPAERPPTEKPKVFQKYLRTWGEGRNDHIELGPSVCQWIQNINLIRLPEGPNWPTVPPHLQLFVTLGPDRPRWIVGRKKFSRGGKLLTPHFDQTLHEKYGCVRMTSIQNCHGYMVCVEKNLDSKTSRTNRGH